MTHPGELVYYDKCGGLYWTVSPFTDPYEEGVGVVVSRVESYRNDVDEDVYWVEVLTEDGSRKKIAIDYLRDVI